MAVPSRANASEKTDDGEGLTHLHKVLRWRIPHSLSTAPWSSPCPAMPARCCTHKTLWRILGWHCRNVWCCTALASFTYARTWYNVPDLSGQTHTASFTFLAGHLHPTPRGDDRMESAAVETKGTAEMPSSHACEGLTFIKSRRTLSPGYYEHVRQILHDLNGHGGSSRMAFQFSYHAIRNRVLVALRPGLKDCTGQVTLS